jgi:hypothetical protein
VLECASLETTARDELDTMLEYGERALVAEGDLLASRQRFEAAYRLAEEVDDPEAMAQAVLGLGGLWVHEQRTAAASTLMRSRLGHVLSIVDSTSTLSLRLRIRLVGEIDYRAGQHAAILGVLDEARAARDPVALVEALSLAHHCLLGPADGPKRRALAGELIGESFRTGRRSDLLMGLLWQTVDLLLDADPHAVRVLCELQALLDKEDHLAVGFVVSAIEVMLAIRTGRFDEAELLAHRCAERGAVAGDVDATGWFGAQLFALRWYQGRVAELLPLLDELVHSPTLSAVDNSYFAALALAAAAAGDRPKAVGALAALCGRDLARLPLSSTWLVTMCGIVEAAHLLEDAELSEQVYHLLSPYAHLPVVASIGVACFGSVHHTLGVASLTAGSVDRAVRHLRAAVQANLAMAHWPAVVSSRLRLAQALTMCGQALDLVAAKRELAAAAEEAAAVGIPLPGGARVSGPASCTRQGRKWQVEWEGRRILVEHSVGMLHLAVLLANPGEEIRAVDLVSGVGALEASSAQAMLDTSAIAEYRQRLNRLRTEVDAGNERARVEHDWLVTELASATGIGGRSRSFSDNGERARVAVGKAIRRAIANIGDADAAIGAHLRDTVHTGTRCCYRATS